jgi:hydroxyethylthiazole kinase
MEVHAALLLRRVRQKQPVVHHLTNWVTIYDCANVVKVLGGSPVMAHAREEVADMVALADSLVLNLGTLTPELVESMKLAARAANARGIPVVLDACGVGATPLRDRKCRELLEEVQIDILKGNASEVARLAGEAVTTRGVDAAAVAGDLPGLAARLARERHLTVVVTGPEDLVTDGKVLWRVRNGDPMMAQVVGTGCMAASVIGAFAAVEPDRPVAAAAALVCFGIAGECAAQGCLGPGSFKECLYDYLYHLNGPTVERLKKVAGCAVFTSSPTGP